MNTFTMKGTVIKKQGDYLRVYTNGKYGGTYMNLKTGRTIGATKYFPLLRAKRDLLKAKR